MTKNLVTIAISPSVVIWAREESVKENRSLSNFIEVKLREAMKTKKEVKING